MAPTPRQSCLSTLREQLASTEDVERFVARVQAGHTPLEDADDAARSRDASLAALLAYGFDRAFAGPERARLAVLHVFRDTVDVDLGPTWDHTLRCVPLDLRGCHVVLGAYKLVTCRNSWAQVLGVKGSQVQILSSRPNAQGRYPINGCQL